ncbi:hypothetical protein ABW636_02045 [Aquimarina sp. 2201CG1-2-11]|uniref:hypothetical protein n=1 Tax=Aquimarina discodermiae TaxID=3231043 RepID=UPI003463717C
MGKIFKSKIIIFLLFPSVFFGQGSKEYYKWFDQVIGHENLALHYGIQYVDKDFGKIFRDEHAFFKSDKPLLINIHYDGQVYYDFYAKYNLETDKLSVAVGNTSLQLSNDNIEKFTINNTQFVKIDGQIDEKTKVSGFYELLLEKKTFKLLKKYRAKRVNEIENGRGKDELKIRFIKKSMYVLNIKDVLHTIKSKIDIIKIYPHMKKEIRSFYKENKVLKEERPDAFMKKMFNTIIQPSALENEL